MTELINNRIQELGWQLSTLNKNIEEQVDKMRRNLESLVPGLHRFATDGARLDEWLTERETKQEELKVLRRILEKGESK